MHRTVVILALLIGVSAISGESFTGLPLKASPFAQQAHTAHTTGNGLPSNEVLKVACDGGGTVYVQTANGFASLDGSTWKSVEASSSVLELFLSPQDRMKDMEFQGSVGEFRDMAVRGEDVCVASESALLFRHDGTWGTYLPREGHRSWAPEDVRAVAYTPEGVLWFASPQGVGARSVDGEWKLYTGAEGLPFDDFTCMATGPSGVWFGTTNGAIQFLDGEWHFRQGQRWLLDNHVNDIAVSPDGTAWIATSRGVSQISSVTMTLAEKAAHFEKEIDRYHRRTEYGYVADAVLPTPGTKDRAAPTDTDNDGHFTGIYLGSASLAYAVTKDPVQKQKAQRAFEALGFLSKVTEGGSNPAPTGLIARAIRPTDGPDPNTILNEHTDRKRRASRDTLWKVMNPRWPVDASGKWYWKCDASSDELDGYYFGFGIYYDRVCETEAEREALRVVVRRMTDHLLQHDLNMVDHDGQPTRWGHFSPADLNQNEAWWIERGLNSLSILTYLQVAHHITGAARYRDAYLSLIHEYGYAMNVMTSPKIQFGPGSLGQADDNMAMMNYYHLIRYETDPDLLSMYYNSIYWYWNNEKFERNPFFNFVYAACCYGKTRTDQWGTRDLTPGMDWMTMAVDTLKRYPMDLIDWPISNAHRIDRVLLGDQTRTPGTPITDAGSRNDGLVYPIDENHAVYWGDDPWALTGSGDGSRMRDPVSFLVAYYLGMAHGFIAE